MQTFVISRTRDDYRQIPQAGLVRFARALEVADLQPHLDVRPLVGTNFNEQVQACLSELSSLPNDDDCLFHTFGTVATAALLRSGAHRRIVATFDESDADPQLEYELARQIDAVMPISENEDRRWTELGIRTLSYGGVPALPIASEIAPVGPTPEGQAFTVLTTSAGSTLEALLTALPRLPEVRLVLAAALPPAQWRSFSESARRLGVRDRLQHWTEQDRWPAADLFVAGPESARHGADCLRAALSSIPTVAVASGAHLDAIVANVTGVLIPPDQWLVRLGQAVHRAQQDRWATQALGEAARARISALHAPEFGGPRVRALYEQLFETPGQEQAETQSGSPSRLDLIAEYLPYAHQLARRYAGRGQSLDDLIQVAAMGLVNAAERFDPSQGSEFHSFATPTILGELRKHFRDHSWAVRVPRRLQEASLRVEAARGEHQSPTTEIAAELGLSEREVRAADQVSAHARRGYSLDLSVGEAGDQVIADLIGGDDPDLNRVEVADAVRQVLAYLPKRERDIIRYRFYGERTQMEIAELLGISQVQVSRLLTRALSVLREQVVFESPAAVKQPA